MNWATVVEMEVVEVEAALDLALEKEAEVGVAFQAWVVVTVCTGSPTSSLAPKEVVAQEVVVVLVQFSTLAQID